LTFLIYNFVFLYPCSQVVNLIPVNSSSGQLVPKSNLIWSLTLTLNFKPYPNLNQVVHDTRKCYCRHQCRYFLQKLSAILLLLYFYQYFFDAYIHVASLLDPWKRDHLVSIIDIGCSGRICRRQHESASVILMRSIPL